MAKVRLAWPEIRSALTAGHTLKLIHSLLAEAGITISYRRLSLYLGRIRREEQSPKRPTRQPGAPTMPTSNTVTAPDDPAANIRDRLIRNRPGFDFKADLPDEDKLI
jgi:hypothetical protein